MARVKTKKQKKVADLRVVAPQIELPTVTKAKSPTTVFSQSQVNLLYRDLLKTFIVTSIVTVVLLSIFLYMR
ncbi:hypothetical protein KA017_01650 [Candidatus Woesebacteria bacterium]|nr:hypothetical protein [Candidatus Woesebacteria bacterium]